MGQSDTNGDSDKSAGKEVQDNETKNKQSQGVLGNWQKKFQDMLSKTQTENFSLKRRLQKKTSNYEAFTRGEIKIGAYLDTFLSFTPIFTIFQNDWAPKYYQIIGGFLNIYKGENARINDQKLTYILEGCTMIQIENDGIANDTFSLQLLDNLGNLVTWVRFKDENQYNAWKDVLVEEGVEKSTKQPRKPNDLQPEVGTDFNASGNLNDMNYKQQQSSNSFSSKQSNKDSDDNGSTVSHQESQKSQKDEDSERENTKVVHKKREKKGKKKPQGPMMGSTPMHRVNQESFLSNSSNLGWNVFEKNPGIANLIIVLFFAYNFRLIIENFLTYGIRNNLYNFLIKQMFQSEKFDSFYHLCYVILAVQWFIALLIEKWAFHWNERIKKKIDSSKKKDKSKADLTKIYKQYRYLETTIIFFALVNIIVIAGLPSLVVIYDKFDAIPGAALMSLTVVEFLKVISYHHCNFDLRVAYRYGFSTAGEMGHPILSIESDGHQILYPDNLTPKNLLYYICAPTLVYQIAYPKADRIHKKRLVMLLVQLNLCIGAMVFIASQYLEPIINNTLVVQKKIQADEVLNQHGYQSYRSFWQNIVLLLGRILKLSVPTIYWWVLMFYAIFHCWLNILAELTRFGDREFYKDWWNATSIGEYWRLWNIPVHKYCLRHIYYPCVRYGYSKVFGSFCVFLASALLHEILIGVPLGSHFPEFYAFYVMIAQFPLSILTEIIKRKTKSTFIGNVSFWSTFCIFGQPLCIILYYYGYIKRNYPDYIRDLSFENTNQFKFSSFQ